MKMSPRTAALLVLATAVVATPLRPGNAQEPGWLAPRQDNDTLCPPVHVFGARETTARPGFGSAETVVSLIIGAFPGTTAEPIDYPASGGDDYASSVAQGIIAVTNQITAFGTRCPDAKIVVVGYSQGSQIMDDAFCGGPDGNSLIITDSTIPTDIAPNIAALIWMGDPRHVAGLPYNVGNATAGGFAARPVDFECPTFSELIQSYCDSPDPFCSNGSDTATHQGYGLEYGDDALFFVQSKLAPLLPAKL